jgi:hypothetical protein
MDRDAIQQQSFNWLGAIKRKTIKNMTHVDFITKYAGVRQDISNAVLILTGLRFQTKQYFLIRIIGALYEPFVGPHYVQINEEPPFWVHSLTAFRREFFGLTDKLSFERSVFVCLSDGEVVRLKIARPYLFVQHDVAISADSKLRIMMTPSTSFQVGQREVDKHKREMAVKREAAVASQLAVRTRVRNHLVGTVQQLFCSYMRDHHIAPQTAQSWFQTDIQFAIGLCDRLYQSNARVRPQRDYLDYMGDQYIQQQAEQKAAEADARGGVAVPTPRSAPALAIMTPDHAQILRTESCHVDLDVASMIRDQRLAGRAASAIPTPSTALLASVEVAVAALDFDPFGPLGGMSFDMLGMPLHMSVGAFGVTSPLLESLPEEDDGVDATLLEL